MDTMDCPYTFVIVNNVTTAILLVISPWFFVNRKKKHKKRSPAATNIPKWQSTHAQYNYVISFFIVVVVVVFLLVDCCVFFYLLVWFLFFFFCLKTIHGVYFEGCVVWYINNTITKIDPMDCPYTLVIVNNMTAILFAISPCFFVEFAKKSTKKRSPADFRLSTNFAAV